MNTVTQFFEEYASLSLSANAEQLARRYAENFIFATKNHSAAFQNDEKFVEWLNGLFEFNKKTGLQKMEVKNIDSIKIGEYFTKATVTWGSTFLKKPEEVISFDLHYILDHSGDDFKIILYISEEDQEQLMKEKGLL
jgi:hypothetical protein